MYLALSETEPVARKEHRCIWCPEKILKGERHLKEASLYQGDFQNHRWHMECRRAATSYFSDHNNDGEFESHEFKRGTTEQLNN